MPKVPGRIPRPAPGQESVWSYPRPPRIEPSRSRILIEHSGQRIVDTRDSFRVLETSLAPSYYVRFVDVADGVLLPNRRRTQCEWKGTAHYWDLVVGQARSAAAAWSYPRPRPGFEALADRVTFYPDRVETCRLEDEKVRAQAGGFYGGWITSHVTGPFKGEPGSATW